MSQPDRASMGQKPCKKQLSPFFENDTKQENSSSHSNSSNSSKSSLNAYSPLSFQDQKNISHSRKIKQYLDLC